MCSVQSDCIPGFACVSSNCNNGAGTPVGYTIHPSCTTPTSSPIQLGTQDDYKQCQTCSILSSKWASAPGASGVGDCHPSKYF